MGRALLIILAGALVGMGFIAMGSSEVSKRITENSSDYASYVNSRNAALTAIQFAMNEINDHDSTWYQKYDSKGSAWNTTINGASVDLYVEEMSKKAQPNTNFQIVTLRVISEADYFGETSRIVSVYEKSRLHYVPEFKGALDIATNQFSINMGGSAKISGKSSKAQCEDKPGINVIDNASYDKVNNFSTSNLDGDPPAEIDSTLSYSPVDELIARLQDMPGVTHLSGNYKGDMGSKDNPGVFFVDEPAKLTGGIDEGYGIMVVRTDGELQYEGDLSVAGNFTFNGLIIFENAWNFDGKGTPSLNGSILVGNTEDTKDLNIDLSGTIDINYDCEAEGYAQTASAELIKQNRYTRLTTYE